MLVKEGFLSRKEVEEAPGFPGSEALRRKRVAILECVQAIPCNPCESACPRGAITIGKPITNLPTIDAEKCTGCGTCIAKCPGLGIFVLDVTGPDVDVVMMPYEYLPLPAEGEEVACLDRQGRVIEAGRVRRVSVSSGNDRTAVVTVEVPKGLAMEARSIRTDKGCLHEDHEEGHCLCEGSESSDDTLVCRCEEVSRREVLDAIRGGVDSLDAVKRRTRAGMGLCQGRNCSRTIASLIARETGKPVSEVLSASKRPPARPARLSVLAREEESEGGAKQQM